TVAHRWWTRTRSAGGHDPVDRADSPGGQDTGPYRTRAGCGRVRGSDRLRGAPLPRCAGVDPQPPWRLHSGRGLPDASSSESNPPEGPSSRLRVTGLERTTGFEPAT